MDHLKRNIKTATPPRRWAAAKPRNVSPATEGGAAAPRQTGRPVASTPPTSRTTPSVIDAVTLSLQCAPYFSEGLAYEVMNMPFHCVIAGRHAFIAGLRRSIERFDKLCLRTVGLGSMVFEEGSNVLVHGGIRFQRGDTPPIETGLWEIATYRDGLIERLIDVYDPGEGAKFERWMAEWRDGLDARYI